MTNLCVASFEFDSFDNLGIIASSNKHGQKVFVFGNSFFSDLTNSRGACFRAAFVSLTVLGRSTGLERFDWKFLDC